MHLTTGQQGEDFTLGWLTIARSSSPCVVGDEKAHESVSGGNQVAPPKSSTHTLVADALPPPVPLEEGQATVTV